MSSKSLLSIQRIRNWKTGLNIKKNRKNRKKKRKRNEELGIYFIAVFMHINGIINKYLCIFDRPKSACQIVSLIPSATFKHKLHKIKQNCLPISPQFKHKLHKLK